MLKQSAALLAILAIATPAHALTGKEIMEKAADKPVPTSTAVKMKMELRKERSGRVEAETRMLQSLTKQSDAGARMVMKFMDPAEIKGVGFLLRENKEGADDMFLYMPALRRVTRISAAKRSENFMGTDFTYADLEPPDSTEATHNLLGEEAVNGVDAYKVETTPKAHETYSKMVSWIRKDNFVPVQTDFYDKNGMHLKRMTVNEVEKQGKYWVPKLTKMENVQAKTSTTLIVLEQQTDIDIDDKFFTERSLQQ